MIQLLFPILKTSHTIQFHFSTEGSLSKFIFETAHSTPCSTDVDALKYPLIQYDTFYSDQILQDSSEYSMMVIEVIIKGSVPYCSSHDNNSTISQSDILFSFMSYVMLWTEISHIWV